jgi:hypothetical protein
MKELVLFIRHFKIIPEGNLAILNIFLSRILIEKLDSYYPFATFTPFRYSIPDYMKGGDFFTVIF